MISTDRYVVTTWVVTYVYKVTQHLVPNLPLPLIWSCVLRSIRFYTKMQLSHQCQWEVLLKVLGHPVDSLRFEIRIQFRFCFAKHTNLLGVFYLNFFWIAAQDEKGEHVPCDGSNEVEATCADHVIGCVEEVGERLTVILKSKLSNQIHLAYQICSYIPSWALSYL